MYDLFQYFLKILGTVCQVDRVPPFQAFHCKHCNPGSDPWITCRKRLKPTTDFPHSSSTFSTIEAVLLTLSIIQVRDREMSNTTRSYLAEGSCASVKHPRAVPRESRSTRWVLHSTVLWSTGAANWKNKKCCCSTTLNTLMPPTPPTHRHLHNVTPTVTQIHLLWLFCLEKQKSSYLSWAEQLQEEAG